MSRYVVVTTTTVAGSGYTSPARTVNKGQVLELSSGEVSAIGGGNLRATTFRDQLGEGAGAANSD